ncbi:CaiB/BaiF CoA-transferase family protein [Leucobacter sp. BZR 635]
MSEQFGALSGLRIVDLSRVLAGPLCTQILGDHGAEVIKVESPAGDDTRRWGPPFVGEDSSAYYENLNRNKRNICLDLKSWIGKQTLERLLDTADVLVENYRPGTLERWGYSDQVIAERWPRLIHCRITGFGDVGPRGGLAGYDAVAQALGGLLHTNGDPSGPPVKLGIPVVDMVTGFYAVTGILLALRAREATGLGQLVDLALFDTAISILHPHSASWLEDGTESERTGSAHPSIQPYDAYDASDGQIYISAGNNEQFRRLCETLGVAALAEDPRFITNGDRVRNVATLRAALSHPLSGFTRGELETELRKVSVPAGSIQTAGEALADPQTIAREMVVQVEGHAEIGIPIKLSRTPGKAVTRPRPRGHDTAAIIAELNQESAGAPSSSPGH